MRVGLFTILGAAAVAVTAFLVARPAGVRYAGTAGTARATVELRLPDGARAPESVTIEVGNGVRITAGRLR
jgi:hypothetical protein